MNEDASRAGRIGPALGALAFTVLLALLWVLRPPLPQIESTTGSMSDVTIEEIIQLVAWSLFALAALRHAYEALHTLIERPSRRLLTETERLDRMLTLPAPKSRPRTHKRYRRPLKLSGSRSTNAKEHHRDLPPTQQPSHAEAQATPPIRISLLGPFKIEGVKHTSVRGACQQLIAYLALRPGGATRDELIEAIWPDQDSRSTNTRHHLYQNVSQARNVLGDALISGRAHYALDRHKVAVDVDELDQALAELDSIDDPKAERPTLERAVRLFRGEPLAGWNQEWTETDVGRLRSAHIELLERTGHTRLVTGDAHGALKAAQQGLTLDSYNEGLWRLAMQADGHLGQRDSVSRRYEQLRRLLGEQLGLEPESATRTLYYELLGQR